MDVNVCALGEKFRRRGVDALLITHQSLTGLRLETNATEATGHTEFIDERWKVRDDFIQR
jgi:hypothetical protein